MTQEKKTTRSEKPVLLAVSTLNIDPVVLPQINPSKPDGISGTIARKCEECPILLSLPLGYVVSCFTCRRDS